MQIHESAEDYLESVLILKNRLGNVRSIDIVNYFDYSKPSISVAMKNLRMNGLNEVRWIEIRSGSVNGVEIVIIGSDSLNSLSSFDLSSFSNMRVNEIESE